VRPGFTGAILVRAMVIPPRERKSLSLVHRVRYPVDPAAGPPPLVVLLHGIGSNELAMASLASSFDRRCIVISPRAPVTLEAFSFAWFHMTFTDDRPIVDLDEIQAARAALVRFLDEAVAAYGADPERVFLVGFSQGCVPAMAALLRAPESVAGVVCMSGWLPTELVEDVDAAVSLRDKPILIVHGRDDETLGVKLGRDAYRVLRSLSAGVEFAEFEMGHTTSPDSLAAVSAWLSRQLDRPAAPAAHGSGS
jgi:phospholipase/carboxylesterase